MELLIQALESAGLAVLLANVITMFVDEEKLKAAGPIVGAVGKFLNLIALNIGENTNSGTE